MPDLGLQFGGDLSLGPTGDIALADGPQLTQQRLLRRLLTNPGDYIWQLSFGAGLGQFVGTPGVAGAIVAAARAQILQEPQVAPMPAPLIAAVAGSGGTVNLTIKYTDAASRQTADLTFSV